MSLESILSKLDGVKRSGSGWKAPCPAHADSNPSLSIHERDGKILLFCHAGCTVKEICAALKIEERDLFNDKPRRTRTKSAPATRIVAEYDYVDEGGKLCYQVVRLEPKTFRQRRPDGLGGWIWNLRGARQVLYRLPEVLAEGAVLICEGEKDCETARALDIVATCNSGGAGKWREEYSQHLRGKQVAIIADADQPGRHHAQKVAHSLYGSVESLKVLEFSDAKDLSEWLENGGTKQQLFALLDNTPHWKPKSVDGIDVLEKLSEYIGRFVSLSKAQTVVVALWVIHTHLVSASDCTPYLAITSAEKQSGKTRLLEVLETVVADPWLTGRVTAAVLIRKIDAGQPTLLLDESDAAFSGEKEYAETLRGVLNTGYRRGGKASCCVGRGTEIGFKDFSTFCAKAIAGIGKLPDTVADRSIPIRLKRAAREEGGIQRFRRRDVEAEAFNLRSQIESFALSIATKVEEARPQLPDELTDRQQDAAEALLAIADLAGGDWPRSGRHALVHICAEAQKADESIGRTLLHDIRQIFDEKDTGRISSAELACGLAEIETSPWGEWSKGRAISPAKVARLLGPFAIAPHNIRVGDRTPKGYEREDFEDAWKRYLGPSQARPTCPPSPFAATTPQANAGAEIRSSSDRHVDENVATLKCQIPNNNKPCGAVALSAVPMPNRENGIEEAL